MADSSNIDEVVHWLEQFLRSFNFTRPGVDRSMGRDLAHLVAGKIADRSEKGLAPDGSRWKANSDTPSRPGGTGYLTEKRKRYGWPESDGKPNYRTSQMLSHMSLFGNPLVTPDRVEMRYGIDEAPKDIHSPIDNRTPSQKKADQSVTDRQKAGWAVENDRPFYAADDQIHVALVEETAKLLAEYMRNIGF